MSESGVEDLKSDLDSKSDFSLVLQKNYKSSPKPG